MAALAAALVVDAQALGRLGRRVQAQVALDRGAVLAKEHGPAPVLRAARSS